MDTEHLNSLKEQISHASVLYDCLTYIWVFDLHLGILIL